MTLMIYRIFLINIFKNLISHGRSKHIEMRFHYLREIASEGKLKLEHYRNGYQMDDLVTNGVLIESFNRLKKYLNMEDLN